MGEDSRVHLPRQLPLELLQKEVRAEERGLDQFDPHAGDHGQGAGHGVVLVAGEDHGLPRLDQRAHGNIQPVGGVERQNDPLRLANPEALGGGLPAGQEGLRCPRRRAVIAPAGAGHGGQGLGHGLGDRRGLLQGGGGAV